jgi:hypothetical protein
LFAQKIIAYLIALKRLILTVLVAVNFNHEA